MDRQSITNTLASNLRFLRINTQVEEPITGKVKYMSQKKLAQFLGTNCEQQISKFELGTNQMSAVQLFKVANELSLTIKDGKMDAGSIDALVEKAVVKAFQEKDLPEVEDMFVQLIGKVQKDVFDSFERTLDSEIDKYLKTVVDRVI